MTTIPFFYRFVFTYLDPLIAGAGGVMCFLNPQGILDGFVAGVKQDPIYNVITEQNGAAVLNLAFITAVLLRYTNDIGVWKIVNMGILLVDILTAYSIQSSLRLQGRFSWGLLRGEDLQWIGGLIFLGATRTAFILGVGLGGNGKGKKA